MTRTYDKTCPHCGAFEGELHKDNCKIMLDRLKAANIQRSQASPRATVPSCLVYIESIPHNEQRYDTCGDWFYQENVDHEPLLKIKVSSLASRREMFLVAIHELVEAFLCECAGVTEAEVDAFDLSRPTEGEEPGDNFQAPYYLQHQIATGIERILAAEAEVSWQEYEQHIKELS